MSDFNLCVGAPQARVVSSMKAPLDISVENRTGWVKAARIYSNVISPPVMFAVLGLAFALKELPFVFGVIWTAVYGLLVSLAPIIFVLYLLQKGIIKELHMSNTRERYLPYAVSILFAGVAFWVIGRFQGPELLRCLALFNMIELALLALINIFWLISLHSTGIMASFVLVGLVFNWGIAIVVVAPFVVTVCWVRLFLKRHTPAQVVAGLALGAISVFSLTLTGCFS